MGVVDPPVPSRALFWAVVVSTVGTFTAGSLVAHLLGMPHASAFSSARLWRVVGIETLLALVWLPVLRRRGWSVACATRSLTLGDVARGVGLLVVGYNLWWLTMWVAGSVGHGVRESLQATRFGGTPSWPAVLVASIVNPMAEEFVYLGFITNVLRRHGGIIAVGSGLLARVAVHLYQGPVRVVGIATLGALLGISYYRSRRLWPAVIAHGFLDALALSLMNAGAA